MSSFRFDVPARLAVGWVGDKLREQWQHTRHIGGAARRPMAKQARGELWVGGRQTARAAAGLAEQLSRRQACDETRARKAAGEARQKCSRQRATLRKQRESTLDIGQWTTLATPDNGQAVRCHDLTRLDR